MGKDILVIDNSKKIGRPNFEFTPKILEQIKNMASYMCSKQEIGKIIGCSESTINRNQLAQEAFQLGDLFDGREYPDAHDLRDKFKFKYVFLS